MEFFERFKEPSSYAPLMGVFTALGWNMPEGMFQDASYILAGVAGIVCFFLKEKVK